MDDMGMKDHYFSQKAHDLLTRDFIIGLFDTVCEVYIDGKWHVFTEQIGVGNSPTSKWDDLVFIGTSNIRRYTNYASWTRRTSANN